MPESLEPKSPEKEPMLYVIESAQKGIVKEFASKEEYEKWWKSGDGPKFTKEIGSFVFREKTSEDEK